MRTTFAIIVAAAVGLFSAVPARAQDAVSVSDAASVSHVLKSTLFDGGNKGGLLQNKGFYFVTTTPASFTCTKACTLEVSIMEQVAGNKTAGNLWAICAEVDNGKKVSFNCPFQGTLPTDKSPVVGNFLGSVPVAAGTHTAQPEVFVSAAAAIISFQIAYRIYQP
jgi:hypothetical protein